MFTGIVEETGSIEEIKRGRNSAVLTIKASKVLENTKIGDSIAVNGICLTVIDISGTGNAVNGSNGKNGGTGIGRFSADVMHETLSRSSLANLARGSIVNLERAMAADGRFGGHIVSGHVDGTGRITSIRRDDTAIWYTIHTAPEIMRYVVEKGSITIDGISLTVARVSPRDFAISAIPHTVSETALRERREGDIVNLETDIIGKYVEKLIFGTDTSAMQNARSNGMNETWRRSANSASGSRITEDFLTKYGF